MKKLCAYMIISAILLSLLSGCGQTAQTTQERDYKEEAEAATAYCIPKEDCYLCGSAGGFMYADYYGQNNVGVISLNTFELMPIEINRYDKNGQLIEENTGVMQSRMFSNGDDGLSLHLMLDADRGIANADIFLRGDRDLDLQNTARYLCADCLKEFAGDLHGDAYGVGIINLSERTISAFQENVVGFGAGDYYIHCDLDQKNEKIKALIALAPLRYADDG